MITALLTAVTIFCLFYRSLPIPVVILLCAGTLLLFHRHEHENRLAIDMLAQKSKLKSFNPMQKFFLAILCMILCLGSETGITGLFLIAVMGFSTVYLGKIRFRDYMQLLTLPMAFLMLSGLALLFEYMPDPVGIIQIPFFQGYLCVTALTQSRTGLVLIKALGSVSCLYFLSLSTPMHEIIGVLNRLPVPKVMIELMYLIYRCIFILLAMYDSMNAAAKSRLGFTGYRTSIKTAGSIYSHLLAKSYRQAMQMFDAMESRCYEGNIAFLSVSYPVKIGPTVFGVCIIAFCIFSLFM